MKHIYMEKITEQSSHYRHLEQMPVSEILRHINAEDQTVPLAVEKALPQMERLVLAIFEKMQGGGRLFYIGAGTSGRLGILDASECPPTYGVPPDLIHGLMAGGDRALRQAVEFAEDNAAQGWLDLMAHRIDAQDVVIGIAASGATPYVVGALGACRQNGILTGCITCNPGSPLAAVADCPVEIITGPEFVTGSTRMKAGTAQKLALNMISTSLMIRLGRVQDHRMVDMQLTNAKLQERGVRMVMDETGMAETDARHCLLAHGNVREAVAAFLKKQAASRC